MNTQIKHIPTGAVYENRKDAKMKMGASKFKRALHNREFLFASAFDPDCKTIKDSILCFDPNY